MSKHAYPDYIEMCTRSIIAFADDGKMDIDEFNELVSVALRDDVVDEDEKRILGRIIERLQPSELTDEFAARIQEVRLAHGF